MGAIFEKLTILALTEDVNQLAASIAGKKGPRLLPEAHKYAI